MGRSVSYPRDSFVCFFDSEEDVEDVIYMFRNWCGDVFPSTYEIDRWIGLENHGLMENGHAYFGLSEYCGLWAAWILPKNDGALCQYWCATAFDRLRLAWESLEPISRASNGEVMYARTRAE